MGLFKCRDRCKSKLRIKEGKQKAKNYKKISKADLKHVRNNNRVLNTQVRNVTKQTAYKNGINPNQFISDSVHSVASAATAIATKGQATIPDNRINSKISSGIQSDIDDLNKSNIPLRKTDTKHDHREKIKMGLLDNKKLKEALTELGKFGLNQSPEAKKELGIALAKEFWYILALAAVGTVCIIKIIIEQFKKK